MNSNARVVFAALALFTGLTCFAQSESANNSSEEPLESYSNWDSIVSGLRNDVNSVSAQTRPESDSPRIDDLKISASVGLAFTYLNLRGDSRFEGSGLLKGAGFQFGIDLFHPELQAEGAFTNYTSDNISQNVRVEAREFDLRLVHSKIMKHDNRLRLGVGLNARSSEMVARTSQGYETRKDMAPSAQFLLGFGRIFARNIFVGPDLSYRTAIAGDSIDKNSLDFHLKAGAVF